MTLGDFGNSLPFETTQHPSGLISVLQCESITELRAGVKSITSRENRLE
jgi:hypothetical protein